MGLVSPLALSTSNASVERGLKAKREVKQHYVIIPFLHHNMIGLQLSCRLPFQRLSRLMNVLPSISNNSTPSVQVILSFRELLLTRRIGYAKSIDLIRSYNYLVRTHQTHQISDSTPSAQRPLFTLVPEHIKTPVSYGILLQGGRYHEMIPRSAQLPCTATQTFETAMSYIESAKITIAWSHSLFAPLTPLIDVEVKGIQMANAGIPKIKVTMDMNEQLKGEVTVLDKVTHAEGKKSFDGNSFLDYLATFHISPISFDVDS